MLKKIVLIVLFAGLLSACGRGHDGGNFAYIGCHVVTENPHCMPGKDKCAFAYGPEGDKKVGEKIYFKQLKKGQDRYGKIGPIQTARPCRDDD
jgi:hypothetical protein|tara:strand:- start:98 stop:376 length:279 start_codon:yes stop_codon:yes gene_type:complete